MPTIHEKARFCGRLTWSTSHQLRSFAMLFIMWKKNIFKSRYRWVLHINAVLLPDRIYFWVKTDCGWDNIFMIIVCAGYKHSLIFILILVANDEYLKLFSKLTHSNSSLHMTHINFSHITHTQSKTKMYVRPLWKLTLFKDILRQAPSGAFNKWITLSKLLSAGVISAFCRRAKD